MIVIRQINESGRGHTIRGTNIFYLYDGVRLFKAEGCVGDYIEMTKEQIKALCSTMGVNPI